MQNNIWCKITDFKLFGTKIFSKEETFTQKEYESEEIKVVTVSDDYFKREFLNKKRI